MDEPQIQTRLPENAYRELKPGETYEPMVPARARVPEISLRSVLFGIAMNIIFSMAATYLALKVGQGIETAIPISILAVGLSGVLIRLGSRASTLLENINIMAIGTASGIVAGGTVFTMPAIYVLKLHDKLEMSGLQLFMQIFLVPFFGAALGVLFLIPFRRYFVKDMHGKLPFPEATATNEILVTGASGGSQASVLVYSFGLGVVYNWLAGAMHLFAETFTTAAVPAMQKFTNNVKAVFSLGTGAEFVGLGYIIGVRYASIICAGSFFSWFVIIPLLAPLDLPMIQRLNPATAAHEGPEEAAPRMSLPGGFESSLATLAEGEAIGEEQRTAVATELKAALVAGGVEPGEKIEVAKSGDAWKLETKQQTFHVRWTEDREALAVFALSPGADDLFRPIPRNIGIGCIFTAGILSILKMSKVIVTALRQALGSLFQGSGTGGSAERTDQDISYPALFGLALVIAIALFAYFRYVAMANMPGGLGLSIIALVLCFALAFLFTTVSAWAIAMISVTPISGMTVTTIIVTAVVLLKAGLTKDAHGMLATLLVGGVVASALSMAGTLVTEFKIGYWQGATPRRIAWTAIIASLLASAAVTATIMILAKSPGYDAKVNVDALQAPQANLMASALESFIGTGQVPWLMYAVGAVIAAFMQLIGISPLAFGLGMYLPMELNTPILAGAIVAALVQKGAKDPALAKARNDKGILIASGLIAGAAIIGVSKSVLNLISETALDKVSVGKSLWGTGANGASNMNWAGLTMFVLLCLFVFVDARRAKPSGEFRDVPTHGH